MELELVGSGHCEKQACPSVCNAAWMLDRMQVELTFLTVSTSRHRQDLALGSSQSPSASVLNHCVPPCVPMFVRFARLVSHRFGVSLSGFGPVFGGSRRLKYFSAGFMAPTAAYTSPLGQHQ